MDGQLSQEFKIPISSFHGASEAYLVPGVLRTTYVVDGLLHDRDRLNVLYSFAGVPAIVLSADSFRQKRETFRGSEFAPRVLAENGFPIVMKVRLRALK